MRNANVPPSHEAMLEAARIAADAHAAGNALLLQIPSSSAPLGAMGPPVGGLPGGEVVFPAAAQLTLFSQLNQLFPALAGQILQQQAQQSAPPSVGPGSYSFSGVSDDRPPSRNERSAKSGDNKSSAAYASRHQAAEQRRRTRINQK